MISSRMAWSVGRLRPSTGLAMLAFVLILAGGCSNVRPTELRELRKPDVAQEFTSIEWAEGEHASNVTDELRRAIRQDTTNIAYDAALKASEKPMLDAKDPSAKRLKGTYKVTAYDPGSTLMRQFFSWARLGKSEMVTEVEYEYEGKKLAHIQIRSFVYFNDILTTVEKQQAEWYWGEAQVYWGDWLGIGSTEARKRRGIDK
jgi:hypothetical protein